MALATPHPSQLKETTAHLQEIFSSIQGEGPYVGFRQIFVRFNVCHLKCAYCDTPPHPATAPCLVEPYSGSGHKEALSNPVSVETVLCWIDRLLAQGPHHSISLTGGEPVLYTPFLTVLLPEASKRLPIYFETSGTLPERLEPLLPWISIVAMDIKLPSTTEEPMRVEEHQRFYQLALGKDLFIKLVVGNQTTPEELSAVLDIVTNRQTPIILQPVTSLTTGKPDITHPKLFELYGFLSTHFDTVRVIPQTHKTLSVL